MKLLISSPSVTLLDFEIQITDSYFQLRCLYLLYFSLAHIGETASPRDQ